MPNMTFKIWIQHLTLTSIIRDIIWTTRLLAIPLLAQISRLVFFVSNDKCDDNNDVSNSYEGDASCGDTCSKISFLLLLVTHGLHLGSHYRRAIWIVASVIHHCSGFCVDLDGWECKHVVVYKARKALLWFAIIRLGETNTILCQIINERMTLHCIDTQEGTEFAVQSDLCTVCPGAWIVFHVAGGRDGQEGVKWIMWISFSGHARDCSWVEGLVNSIVCHNLNDQRRQSQHILRRQHHLPKRKVCPHQLLPLRFERFLNTLIKYYQWNTRIQNRPSILGIELICIEVQLDNRLPISIRDNTLSSPLTEVNIPNKDFVPRLSLLLHILNIYHGCIQYLWIVSPQRNNTGTTHVTFPQYLLFKTHAEPGILQFILKYHLIHKRSSCSTKPHDSILNLRRIPPRSLRLTRKHQRKAIPFGSIRSGWIHQAQTGQFRLGPTHVEIIACFVGSPRRFIH
mmetsp:Transcript_8011/g.17836  ORF Transcript_8011/g.17836 Transcript_8011/m.17836 type:complete len:455 (-) Transcript_8011:1002-2366(-)